MKFFNKARTLLLAPTTVLLSASATASDLKYVFFFIGDGMGIAEATNAQLFNKEVLGSDTPLLMTTFPVVRTRQARM